MKKSTNSTVNSAGAPSEDNTYVNLKDLRAPKRERCPNQKATPEAKNTQHQVLLILLVLLILVFLALVVLTAFLFVKYTTIAEEVSQMKNNETQILKSEMNELEKRGAEIAEVMKRKWNELESRVNRSTSDLQKIVQNLKKRPSCESRWLEFEGHCYFFSDFEQNWSRAEMMCLSRGSHLVIINSQAEQDFLNSKRSNGKYYWIGLTDLEKEGTFKWIDGTGLSYTLWSNNEPNNGGKNENCCHLYKDGKWNDYKCHEYSYAICEKKMM